MHKAIAPVRKVLIGLLLASGSIAFIPALSGGFLFDDYSNLLLEHDWRIASLEWEYVVRSLSHGEAGPLGRPLALLSFGLTFLFAGLDPYWFKLGNLLLHVFNGVLVFCFCRALFDATEDHVRGIGIPHDWVAACCAFTWLVHPMQVSTVMYTVQRMEIGAATGILISLYAYVRGRRAQLKGAHGSRWFLVFALGLALGLGFKESAVVGFGLAFLIELLVFRLRRPDNTLSSTWAFLYSIGFIVTLVVFATYIVPLSGPEGLYAARDFNAYERLLTQPAVLSMYLGQILLPTPSHFSFYYDNFPVSRTLLAPTSLVGVAILASMAVVALLNWRKRPLTTFGILWFLTGHALTSSILPLELAFEHRNYLPLLGIVLALVPILVELSRRLRLSPGVAKSIIASCGISLASLCAIQSATWGDPMLLAMSLEQRNPTSQRASYDLARRYLEYAGDDKDNPLWTMALDQLEIAAALPGSSPLPVHGLILLKSRNRLEVPTELWGRLRGLLTRNQIAPEGLSSLYAISNCRIQRECVLDERQLLHTFLIVLQHNPSNAALHTMYSNFTWNVIGDQELAIHLQRQAVTLSSNNANYRAGLAKLLLASADEANQAEAQRILHELAAENVNLHGEKGPYTPGEL